MEAKRTKNAEDVVNVNVTLRRVKRNLTDDQVLELYRSGRALYVEEDADEDVRVMMKKAIVRTLKCGHLATGKSEDDVRKYYMKMFGSERQDYILRCMRDKTKRAQFICEQVGVLMSMGVIFGKTRDIAYALNYKSLKIESVMRYIRKGKK